MVHGEARVFIERPVTDIADVIMDLHGYKNVDAKLGRTYELARRERRATVRVVAGRFGVAETPGGFRSVRVAGGTGTASTRLGWRALRG
jgi:hypothetical protein